MTYNILITISILSKLVEARVQQGGLLDYPYIAMIGTFTDQNFQFTSICVGSILTRRFILTTAHCFRQEENWIALIGTVAQEKYAAVLEKWILHPHYIATVDATYNDVALAVTEKFMDFEKYRVKPVSIQQLPLNAIHHDLFCRMIGWEIAEPENFTADLTSREFIAQAEVMSAIYSVKKSFLSPKQCQSLINLIPDVTIMPNSGFLCVRNQEDPSNEFQYGYIGSPLLCKEDEHDSEWFLMGMKLKHRNTENGMPEIFVNIHPYREYLYNTIKHPFKDPLKYFCLLRVCDKKHNVAGEYCLVGDVEDCYYGNYPSNYYFPIKSYSVESSEISSALMCSVVISLLLIFNENIE